MEKLGKWSSRVKVESMLSVVSSRPTEAGKVHKLSVLEQAMGLHTVHVVFYYRSNPFSDHGAMASELDNLRVSLSRTLDEYPMVTGRLARGVDGGWQVKCNDAGVRMLQASVSVTIDEWLRSADAAEERALTMWEDMPQDPTFWSPFRIQINNFKCGGLGIGLSCTHMHADITSAALLIKSWSQIHRGQPLTHSPIFHLPTSQSNSINHNNIPSFFKSTDENVPKQLGTVTMKFSASVIKEWLSKVANQCPTATPFDILLALLWSRIAQWQQESPANNHSKRSLCICMDARNRVTSYFGNALQFSVLDVDGDLLVSGEIGHVCERVHRHVKGAQNEDFCSGGQLYGPQLTCINTEHMVDADIYGAEFLKGERPVHVSCNVGHVELGEGLIMVMPTSEAGLGRTVTLVLPEDHISKLCEDQTIRNMEPTMLISGTKS